MNETPVSSEVPVSISDLPRLLAPHAALAPIYVYLMADGNALARRELLPEDDAEDLILILKPRTRARSYPCPLPSSPALPS